MRDFVEDLKRIISIIRSDNEFIHFEKKSIQTLSLAAVRTHETLLKSLWLLHSQRVWLLLRKYETHDRTQKHLPTRTPRLWNLTFDRSAFFGTTSHGSYLELINLLKQDVLLWHRLLNCFQKNPLVYGRLCFFLFSTVGNFSLSLDNIVFLIAVLEHLFSSLLSLDHELSHALGDDRFAVPAHILLDGLPDVKRFLTALLNDIVVKVVLASCSPDRTSSKERRNQPTEVRSFFYYDTPCLPRYHSEKQLFSLVDHFISRLTESVPLFPSSHLMLLGKIRRYASGLNYPRDMIYDVTVDFLFSFFLNRPLLDPELFGAYSGPPLDPCGREILKQLATTINFMAHMNPSAPIEEAKLARLSADIGFHVGKLTDRCAFTQLHMAISQIANLADTALNNSQAKKTERSMASDKNVVGSKLPHEVLLDMKDASRAPILSSPPTMLVSATDLNILVDCLRIFLHYSAYEPEGLRKVLDRITDRIPGSKLGVKGGKTRRASLQISTRNEGSVTLPSDSYKVVSYELDELEPYPDVTTPPNTPKLPSVKRSRSTSSRNLKTESLSSRLQTHSSSVSRAGTPEQAVAQQASPCPQRLPSKEVIYIVPVGACSSFAEPCILSEEEFFSSQSLARSHPSGASVDIPNSLAVNMDASRSFVDDSSNALTRSSGGQSEEMANHPEIQGQVSHSQSSSGLSRSSGDLRDGDRDGNDDDGDDDDDGEGSSPLHAQHPHRIRHSSSSRAMIEANFRSGALLLGANNEDESLAEDRSNDPSSDASERSGCTSLASSAHALGRRLRAVGEVGRACDHGSEGAHNPPQTSTAAQEVNQFQAGGEYENFPATSDTLVSRSGRNEHERGEQEQQPSTSTGTAHEGTEKRTRFSVVDVSQGAIRGSGNVSQTQSISGDPVNQRSKLTEAFSRSVVVRTCSVELVGASSSANPAQSSAAEVQIGKCSSNYRGISMDSDLLVQQRRAPTSSNSIRSSSLGCLPSHGLSRSPVVGASVLGVHNSEVPEEQSSIHTCSSCDIRIQNNRLNAARTLMGADASNADLASQAQLEDGQSAGHLDEDDALSDIPLSSANVSGRVTPLSLTSSTSRGGGITLNQSAENHGVRAAGYTRAGLVLPNGVSLPAATVNGGVVRGGILEFTSTLLPRHGSPDVTDKFGKFDLPNPRIPEEARSTVSDTWSTDVLPSDTEYPDMGQDFLVPEVSTNETHRRNQNLRRHDTASRRHGHHRHAHLYESRLIDGSSENMVGHQLESSVIHRISSGNASTVHTTSSTETDPNLSPAEQRNNERSHPSSQGTGVAVDCTSHNHVSAENSQTPVSALCPFSENMVSTTAGAVTSLTLSTGGDAPTNSVSPALTPLGGQAACAGENYPDPQALNNLPDGPDGCRPHFSPNLSEQNKVAGAVPSGDQSGFQRPISMNRTSPPLTLLQMAQGATRPVPSTSHSADTVRDCAFPQPEKNSVEKPSTAQKQQVSSSKPKGDRKDEESVDEMMARYRRQTEVLRGPQAHVFGPTKVSAPSMRDENPDAQQFPGVMSSASHSAVGRCSRSITLDQWSRKAREQIRKGIRAIFSDPSVGPFAAEVVDKVAISFPLLSRDASSVTCKPTTSSAVGSSSNDEDGLLLALMDACLAEAVTLGSTSLTTCIRETIRLMRLLLGTRTSSSISSPQYSSGWSASVDHEFHQLLSNEQVADHRHKPLANHLISQLRSDRDRRHAYFAYLLEARDHVLAVDRYLDQLRRRSERIVQVQFEYMLHKCLSSFMDSQISVIQSFYAQFAAERANNVSEENCRPAHHLVSSLIEDLLAKWEENEASRVERIKALGEEDSDFVYLSSATRSRTQLERLVMEKIYRSGIWMNDASAEHERDVLMHREVATLARVISLTELQVPERLHVLRPFQSVQEELRMLDTAHVPSAMIHCLKRVMERIVSSIQLVCPNSMPSADEVLPVLIYVIVQVNPPRLLTNMTFIEMFCPTLEGEEQYIWCQFQAAVAEIRRLLTVLVLNEHQRISPGK
ncbi:unnamed protein product [Calicophoron daubneyi]|uniref:Uncharacterized protein n=1 Tax=Calicophoron daubneyi TaxID=300641 RepID=A0AAV2U1T2_CALDB